jgi:phosphohistidine phosphatase
MTLYLVQHGKALMKETDPERSLSEDGRAETERVAARAGELRLSVSGIVHSGKKRARQTAEILASRLTPGTTPAAWAGLDPDDDVETIAEMLAGRDNLMLVGHLPFLEELAAFLTVGSSTLRPIRFTNSGIVCLEERETDSGNKTWAIKWALTPEIS